MHIDVLKGAKGVRSLIKSLSGLNHKFMCRIDPTN